MTAMVKGNERWGYEQLLNIKDIRLVYAPRDYPWQLVTM